VLNCVATYTLRGSAALRYRPEGSRSRALYTYTSCRCAVKPGIEKPTASASTSLHLSPTFFTFLTTRASFPFRVMSPASSSRLSGAFNIYRLCTLFAVGVLAAAECKVTAWNIYMFWNAMATVVVSVAACVPSLFWRECLAEYNHVAVWRRTRPGAQPQGLCGWSWSWPPQLYLAPCGLSVRLSTFPQLDSGLLGPLSAAVRSLLLRVSSCAQPTPVALYDLVLAITFICLLCLKENSWTRPVHAMDTGRIVLEEE
jgi:hypothetical protein